MPRIETLILAAVLGLTALAGQAWDPASSTGEPRGGAVAGPSVPALDATPGVPGDDAAQPLTVLVSSTSAGLDDEDQAPDDSSPLSPTVLASCRFAAPAGLIPLARPVRAGSHFGGFRLRC
jgi:hypothetical protein